MRLEEMTWPAVAGLDRDTPIVFPVAALEQHGGHLPVFTDSMLLGEVVRRVEPALADRVLFVPLQWLGNSSHHLDFPGSMSANPRGYLDMLHDMAENFLRHGFRRLAFLNGHGGNTIPGKQAVFELRQKHRDRSDLLLLFTTYWDVGAPNKVRGDFTQSQMGHACEWETSMILRLAPHLVGDIRHLAPVEFGFAFEPAYRGWTTRDRTVPGHIGDPAKATADKGETLFATFSAGVIDWLKQVLAWDGKSWSQ